MRLNLLRISVKLVHSRGRLQEGVVVLGMEVSAVVMNIETESFAVMEH